MKRFVLFSLGLLLAPAISQAQFGGLRINNNIVKG